MRWSLGHVCSWCLCCCCCCCRWSGRWSWPLNGNNQATFSGKFDLEWAWPGLHCSCSFSCSRLPEGKCKKVFGICCSTFYILRTQQQCSFLFFVSCFCTSPISPQTCAEYLPHSTGQLPGGSSLLIIAAANADALRAASLQSQCVHDIIAVLLQRTARGLESGHCLLSMQVSGSRCWSTTATGKYNNSQQCKYNAVGAFFPAPTENPATATTVPACRAAIGPTCAWLHRKNCIPSALRGRPITIIQRAPMAFTTIRRPLATWWPTAAKSFASAGGLNTYVVMSAMPPGHQDPRTPGPQGDALCP